MGIFLSPFLTCKVQLCSFNLRSYLNCSKLKLRIVFSFLEYGLRRDIEILKIPGLVLMLSYKMVGLCALFLFPIFQLWTIVCTLILFLHRGLCFFQDKLQLNLLKSFFSVDWRDCCLQIQKPNGPVCKRVKQNSVLRQHVIYIKRRKISFKKIVYSSSIIIH